MDSYSFFFVPQVCCASSLHRSPRGLGCALQPLRRGRPRLPHRRVHARNPQHRNQHVRSRLQAPGPGSQAHPHTHRDARRTGVHILCIGTYVVIVIYQHRNKHVRLNPSPFFFQLRALHEAIHQFRCIHYLRRFLVFPFFYRIHLRLNLDFYFFSSAPYTKPRTSFDASAI